MDSLARFSGNLARIFRSPAMPKAQERIIVTPGMARWRWVVRQPLVRGAVVYGGMLFLLTAFFAFSRHLPLIMALWSIPLGVFFGLAIGGCERLLALLWDYPGRRVRGIPAAFIFFFAYVIGYVLLFSLLVGYPLGRLLAVYGTSELLKIDYALFSTHFVLALAGISWLLNIIRQRRRARGGESQSP